MSDLRLFTESDCSLWLAQIAYAYSESLVWRYYDEDNNSHISALIDTILEIADLATPLTLLIIYLLRTYKLRQRVGCSHYLLIFWTVLQIFPIPDQIRIMIQSKSKSETNV